MYKRMTINQKNLMTQKWKYYKNNLNMINRKVN